MIKYKLICGADHEFEGWFRDSDDFEIQSQDGLVECPSCGTGSVRKAVMAPAVARRGRARSERMSAVHEDMRQAVERARDYVEKNFDYVGERFPDEARKIHYGEAPDRSIYGEASGKDVKSLIDEGVQVSPLPGLDKKADRAGEQKSPAAPKKLN